ncbi:MAG: NAD-dependent epimerase/dehydratase family protein [Acidobacteria bacterium]|nr:NAD-dependent epimerase/dehydratase family protein [Acidobacteriota bacterium]
MKRLFITGGTGYMGRPLIPELQRIGWHVRALVRSGSENKLPQGCEAIIGDALHSNSYASQVRPADTFVHLVGVSHPNPAKAAEFRSVDFTALQASVAAAVESGCNHFVYVSVAQPAPVMKAYLQVRAECEEVIRGSGLHATILRPWYVLGPSHRWPYLLLPMYWVLERLPATRESAHRLGLITLDQMIRALVGAVERPCSGIRVLGVPELRRA